MAIHAVAQDPAKLGDVGLAESLAVRDPKRVLVEIDRDTLVTRASAAVALHDQAAHRLRIERQEPVERLLLGLMIAPGAARHGEQQPDPRIVAALSDRGFESCPRLARPALLQGGDALAK